VIAGMHPVLFAAAVTFGAAGFLLLTHVVVSAIAGKDRPPSDRAADREDAT
jgi:hypothetical protein